MFGSSLGGGRQFYARLSNTLAATLSVISVKIENLSRHDFARHFGNSLHVRVFEEIDVVCPAVIQLISASPPNKVINQNIYRQTFLFINFFF